MRNEKLISALESVISGLESGSVNYDWEKVCQCNCGLVAQAITGLQDKELYEKLLHPMIEKYHDASEGRRKLNHKKKYDPTWCQLVAEYCPLTGMPMEGIFKILYEAGMTRENIAHLENLSDKTILERAEINTESIINYKKERLEVKKRVYRDGILGFFGFKKTIIEFIDGHNDIKAGIKKYYAGSHNLLKYLKAWVEILKEEKIPTPQQRQGEGRIHRHSTPNSEPLGTTGCVDMTGNNYHKQLFINGSIRSYETREDLEAMKKEFVEAQDFEACAILRDEINRFEASQTIDKK